MSSSRIGFPVKIGFLFLKYGLLSSNEIKTFFAKSARILFVKPKNHARLHEVTAVGLTPGVVVTLHQRSPTYRIRYDGTELALDHRVAEDLLVCPINRDNRAALIRTPHRHRRREGLFHWLRFKER